VNGSARVPTKDVPSCDKPEGSHGSEELGMSE